jgi:hypothetical protein
MSYTLLFGNNFIYESPQSVGIYDKILFYLSEDDHGPYLTTEIFDSIGENVIVRVEKNTCTYLHEKELIQKYNHRDYILINNKEGENIIQSRILDKNTILVSGIFHFKEFKLIATQNYIVLPDGKRMMYNKINSKNGHVTITHEGIRSETNNSI